MFLPAFALGFTSAGLLARLVRYFHVSGVDLVTRSESPFGAGIAVLLWTLAHRALLTEVWGPAYADDVRRVLRCVGFRILETARALARAVTGKTLVLTGVAANNCVLFTAHDAYMREFRLLVPRDCVASESEAVRRPLGRSSDPLASS